MAEGLSVVAYFSLCPTKCELLGLLNLVCTFIHLLFLGKPYPWFSKFNAQLCVLSFVLFNDATLVKLTVKTLVYKQRRDRITQI